MSYISTVNCGYRVTLPLFALDIIHPAVRLNKGRALTSESCCYFCVTASLAQLLSVALFINSCVDPAAELDVLRHKYAELQQAYLSKETEVHANIITLWVE